MLELQNIYSGYGNMTVVRDVSFSVAPGEIVLIAGENGAGKSTLMRTIAGFIKPISGSILLGRTHIEGKNPESIVDRGLRLVLDGHRVFPELSVRDNLRMGALGGRARLKHYASAVDQVYATFPILREKAANLARDLSGGQQQMLALGQAFLARPDVLLCDEPSLGLAVPLLPKILAFLKAWSEQGASIIIVEQHLDFAMTIAHRVIYLERGGIRFQGSPDDFKARIAIVN